MYSHLTHLLVLGMDGDGVGDVEPLGQEAVQ
jgi:hypothetical protein